LSVAVEEGGNRGCSGKEGGPHSESGRRIFKRREGTQKKKDGRKSLAKKEKKVITENKQTHGSFGKGRVPGGKGFSQNAGRKELRCPTNQLSGERRPPAIRTDLFSWKSCKGETRINICLNGKQRRSKGERGFAFPSDRGQKCFRLREKRRGCG